MRKPSFDSISNCGEFHWEYWEHQDQEWYLKSALVGEADVLALLLADKALKGTIVLFQLIKTQWICFLELVIIDSMRLAEAVLSQLPATGML